MAVPLVSTGADRTDDAPSSARSSAGVDDDTAPVVRYPTAAVRAAEPPTDAMPFPVRPPAQVAGGTCPHCGRPLPTDRSVTFCPYCGENLTVRRCPACSTELDAAWRFCITCGREVDAPARAEGS
jgi:predicted RNA-binding Zn-ribbon protein involved in translation (DUF1610 family)